jgi:hypothetical protein
LVRALGEEPIAHAVRILRVLGQQIVSAVEAHLLDHGLEIAAQELDALVAARRVFLQALVDEAHDLFGHERVQVLERTRLDGEDLAQHARVGVALEWTRAAEQLVAHHAGREDVGAAVDRLARRLLGRHVGRRAEHRAGRRHRRRVLAAPREPEVHDLDGALGRQHDVRGLDVAVDEAVVVRVLDAAADVAQDEQHHLDGRRAVGLDPLLQVEALDELHGDVRRVLEAAAVDDLHDVLVAQHRGRARLAFEALDERDIVGQVRMQHLEHDLAVERLLHAEIDGRHATDADLLPQLERAEVPVHGHAAVP